MPMGARILRRRENVLEGRPGNHGRVLVVDDDPKLSRIFAEVLHGAGFAVDTAADGRHALALLERLSFDTVITDLALPGMAGMEILRTLRARAPEWPVRLLTGTP